MYCPVCSAVTVEASRLLYPATTEEPDEYVEFSECISCGWTDLSVTEEIPFQDKNYGEVNSCKWLRHIIIVTGQNIESIINTKVLIQYNSN